MTFMVNASIKRIGVCLNSHGQVMSQRSWHLRISIILTCFFFMVNALIKCTNKHAINGLQYFISVNHYFTIL